MRRAMRRLFANESGATAVEYAMLLVLIVAVVIGSVTVIGTVTQGSFQSSQQKMQTAGVGQ